jgi:hypothetical protein
MQLKSEFGESATMYPLPKFDEETDFSASAQSLSKKKGQKKWQDKARRKKRTTFKPDQLSVLLEQFEINQNPSSATMTSIALKLEMQESVSIYF